MHKQSWNLVGCTCLGLAFTNSIENVGKLRRKRQTRQAVLPMVSSTQTKQSEGLPGAGTRILMAERVIAWEMVDQSHIILISGLMIHRSFRDSHD